CLWIPPGVDRLTDARAAQSHRAGASVPPRGEVPRVETGRRWNNAGVPDSTESDTSASDTSTTDAAASDATASALVTSPRPNGDPRLTSAVYVAAPEGDTGKSTVALGLLRILAGTVQKVGVF